jgi:hypothetical protein
VQAGILASWLNYSSILIKELEEDAMISRVILSYCGTSLQY